MKTLKQAMEMIQNGIPAVIVEYRASQASNISWRDKETKAVLSANLLKHTVENADGAIMVDERVDNEKFVPADYKSPFKKGDRVLLILKSLYQEKGVWKASGTLEGLSKE